MRPKVVEVINNKFVYDELSYSLDDLFTYDFYQWSNTQASKYENGIICDNLVYLNVFMNVLAIRLFIKKKDVGVIKIISADPKTVCYIIDASAMEKISVEYDRNMTFHMSNANVRIIMLGELFYLALCQLKIRKVSREIKLEKDFSVIRTAASKKKIPPTESREIFFEDSVGCGSLYSFLGIRKRLVLLLKAYSNARVTFMDFCKALNNNGFEYTKSVAFDFIKYRIVPVEFYGMVLEELMKLPWKGQFISGNNLDMYACIEEKIAKRYNKKTVCIPHGLEYGYLFPHGFTGDLFYTTSQNASQWLNNLYGTNKFFFDEKIAHDMFHYASIKNNERKVVYFSEPREPYVNIDILRKLIPNLNNCGIPLYIKHHPGDNLSDYLVFKNTLCEIKDLKEAICGNICISRKSTVLLEGLYNNATCAAIITNEKDAAVFHTFPSLANPDIKVFHDIDKLCEWISEVYIPVCKDRC